MPEFAFGVDPWRKGSSMNPFPPDLPHGQLDTPVTLTNPTDQTVFTDYGPIPPGGSLQVPGLTDFDLSLISAKMLESNVTNNMGQMAPVSGTISVSVDSSGNLFPTVIVRGFCNGSFAGSIPFNHYGPGFSAGVFTFVTYGQTSNSGSGSFTFTCGSTGGQASDNLIMTISIEMDLAVTNNGVTQDPNTGNTLFRSYTVQQDPFTGLYLIEQPPQISPSTAGPATFLTTSPQIKYYSTASTDPTKPIGATVTYSLAWLRS